MSSQLTDQIKVWWKTVSDKDSLGTYQKTIQTTWSILRETGRLIWLVLCLGLVLVTWLWTSSKTSSQQLTNWYEGIPEPKSENLWTEVSQFLKSASQGTASKVMTQAREQLGLSAPAPAPVTGAVAAAPVPVAVPAPVAPAPAAPEPPAATEENT
jgi:hypothetical protein